MRTVVQKTVVSKQKFGFTLVELLVVITIIGLLMSVSLVGLRASRNRARVAQAKNDMRYYGMAVQEYHNQNLLTQYKWPTTGNTAAVCTDMSVPGDMFGVWKGADPKKFCYYTQTYGSSPDITTEVGLLWPGIGGQGSDATSLDDDDVLLIIQKPKAQVNNNPVPGVSGRITYLDNAGNQVIYMDGAN